MKLALRIVLFVIGCWLLSYGSAMVLFVPGARGHYFDANLVKYGIVPLVLSVSLFAVVGVLSARWKQSGHIGRSIATTVSFGISAVVLFYIAMGVVGNLRK
jgi:hypothetical protein